MRDLTPASAPRYGIDYDAGGGVVIYDAPADVIEQWASTCRCCSTCWECPCPACCAGGICDAMPCNCDSVHLWDDDHDYSDEAEDEP